METLRRRAEILQEIRLYFAQNNVLEVDTPLLMPFGAPDPALNSFVSKPHAELVHALHGYLQTSPEFAMKRLLAAGSGDIYQLCHAFRAENPGRHHLPEFTLLEWYRLGFDHHRLMDDVEALVSAIVPTMNFARRRYRDVFKAGTGLDPHDASTDALSAAALRCNIELGDAGDDRPSLLEALFAHVMVRDDASRQALFVYDFPVEQAAYARIDAGPPAVAQRFELLIGGIEIANGYFEVVDPVEQLARHDHEHRRRQYLGLPAVELDPLFMAALESGPLPACAGVALGVDRLVMLSGQLGSVSGAVSFDPFDTN